jgi:hypothetical protein
MSEYSKSYQITGEGAKKVPLMRLVPFGFRVERREVTKLKPDESEKGLIKRTSVKNVIIPQGVPTKVLPRELDVERDDQESLPVIH